MTTEQKLDLLRNELQNIFSDLEYEDTSISSISKIGRYKLAV